jgi:DNA-binding MarR family transcriptional regulator
MQANDFELATFLPYQLAVLSERISKRLAVYYETEFGLSMAEWRVLVHLSRCPLVSVREIHNCVNLEKSRVSRAVRKLEVRKMLRKSESTQDHRLLNIALTAKGRNVLAKILTFALSFEKTLLAALEPQDADVLKSAFETLHCALDGDPQAGLRSILDVPTALAAKGSA